MDNTSLSHSYSGSCATADNKKTYSAQELGELMNTYPRKLLDLNIGFITRWFDCVFIEDVLRCVERERDINMLIELIEIEWKFEVGERNENVVSFNDELKLWQPLNEHFTADLHQVWERVMTYRRNKERKQMMIKKWKATYPRPEDDIKFRLSDLPSDAKAILTINDDWLYSEFVELMLGPVNDWINERRLCDWSVVRFICLLRGIIKRGSSQAAFVRLGKCLGLHIKPGSFKYRKDANNDNYLNIYDASTPENPIAEIAILKKDGQQIEEILHSVISYIHTK